MILILKPSVISHFIIGLYFLSNRVQTQDIVFKDASEDTSHNKGLVSYLHKLNFEVLGQPRPQQRPSKGLCETCCVPLDLCPQLFELFKTQTPESILAVQKASCGFSPKGDPLVWCNDFICGHYTLESSSSPCNRDIDIEIGFGRLVPEHDLGSGYHKGSSEETDPKIEPRVYVDPSENPIKRDEPSSFPNVQRIRRLQSLNSAIKRTEEICGVAINSRINGGTTASKGEFPWIVAIMIHSSKGPQVACSGSLILEDWILTAAHCVLGSNRQLRNVYQNILLTFISHIRAGAHALYEHETGDVDLSADDIFVHEEFQQRTFVQHDIALIKLKAKVQLSSTIWPICLPKVRSRLEESSESGSTRMGMIGGWGGNGFVRSQATLQKAIVPILPGRECQRIFSRVRVGINPSHQLCAGSLGIDSCKGDSGGSLMGTMRDGKIEVLGLISYGTVKCDGRLPGVFTRIDRYLNWIYDTILRNY